MASSIHELALRYLLELSSDIRAALLWDGEGTLLGTAPAGAPARLAELGSELAREAGASLRNGRESTLEVDAGCEGGAVFLIHDEGLSMICLTDRSVLPGLIFYDMHAVLRDLDRAAEAESRRESVRVK